MREFRIAFAQCDSSGLLRLDVAERLGKRIAEVYGGFTRLDGVGGYHMPSGEFVSESVFVFDVATNSDKDSVATFAAMISEFVRRDMEQESVYFRNVDGNVYIMDREGF